MVKRHKLATRAFGAEPGLPEVAALSEWIAKHRGRTADIITYQLDQALALQLEAGIGSSCAGGKFYADRILASLCGVEGRKATGELHVESSAIIEDAAGIVVQKKGAWCAMPAPHVLNIRDDYYDDEYEWSDAICRAYRTVMRSMRDIGVPGHILICDKLDEAELLALIQPKVFFFQPAPDTQSLANLLERQQQIAVRKTDLPKLFSLTDEYHVRKLFIIDPDAAAISSVLAHHMDPDQIVAGGYGEDVSESYWKDLVGAAEYLV
jgi:hypothetical protein